MTRRKRWSFHVCAPWSGGCRMRGIRLNIKVPGHFIYVGLLGGQVMEADGKWHRLSINRDSTP